MYAIQPFVSATSVDIVLSGSSTHLVGLEATARSLVQNSVTPEAISLHVFQLDVDKFDVRRLQILQKTITDRGSTFLLHNFSESAIEPYLNKRLTTEHNCTRLSAPSNYVRFILADVLPRSITRCMYMDTDIIALRDVVPFFERISHLASSKIVAAFPREFRNIGKEAYRQLIDHGIDVAEPLPNFNAGLLIINLELWRSHNISAKSAEIASLNNQLNLWPRFGSQPPLVVLLGGSRFEKLNDSLFLNNAAHASSVQEHIMFIHWNGKRKPWMPCDGCNGTFSMWSRYAGFEYA